MRAYPYAKAILTVRDSNSWATSYSRHVSPERLGRYSNFGVRLGNALGLRMQTRKMGALPLENRHANKGLRLGPS